ncbi:hypothetical protein D1224_15780 [Henriciella barbarensis]|uniref:Lipoprotein n=1 Tax=Henriciella barbarensis TaxID=86342 RepID=A0A399QNY3_9PROT|nr:hypothetical protein [Henriciella barbarensis]RIJ20568.1 hypothetical protein D1224_15780 [Henriciella barbarensis]
MKRIVSSIVALAALAACESVGAADSTKVPETPRAERSAADQALAAQGLAPAVSVIPQSGLQAQTLASNECGLFLWSKTQPDRLIFFQRAASGQARMIIANETIDAVQTANRGGIFGQFMTKQVFLTPSGQQVLVSFEPGEELQGGQRIDNGRLTITAEEGWRTVIPVLGVSACKP